MAQASHCNIFMRISMEGEDTKTAASDSDKHVGESWDEQFWDYIEIDHFSFSGPDVAGGGSGGQKAKLLKKAIKAQQDGKDVDLSKLQEGFDDAKSGKSKAKFGFKVKKGYDQESPMLLQSLCKNFSVNDTDRDEIKQVVVVFRIITGSSSKDYLLKVVMVFENCFVVRYEMSVDEETSVPDEDIDFVFKKVTMRYTPQSETGAAGKKGYTGWDFEKNKAYTYPQIGSF
jgi:type VI protein secretion system component Hcp